MFNIIYMILTYSYYLDTINIQIIRVCQYQALSSIHIIYDDTLIESIVIYVISIVILYILSYVNIR